jgi:CheY-like chemotaxis protein
MAADEGAALDSGKQAALPLRDAPPPFAPSPARSAYVRGLRHDLRTPVNHIIGYSEVLLEEALEHGLGSFIPDLQRVHAAGGALLKLIEQGLEPLHGDARKIDMALLRHEFRTPVNHVIGYSEMLLEEAFDLDDQRGDELIADLQRIHSAGRELLELINASLADSTREIGVEHAETHEGPPLASLDSLLATAQALLERDPAGLRGEHGDLLVVDDNELNRDMLSRRLERLGYRVQCVEGGQQALSMLRLLAFDLILLDIMMPGIDGYQVLKQLKADPQLRNIPVIVLSALNEIDSVVRCIRMGAEDHLPKPFDPVLLRARIGACLEKKRLRDLELEYLRQVARLTTAAADVEAGHFDAESLADVARRDDQLGQLARVFQRMAREVAAREQRLKQQVQELRIAIDERRKSQQVAEITETDYFASLQAKARRMRASNPKPEH